MNNTESQNFATDAALLTLTRVQYDALPAATQEVLVGYVTGDTRAYLTWRLPVTQLVKLFLVLEAELSAARAAVVLLRQDVLPLKAKLAAERATVSKLKKSIPRPEQEEEEWAYPPEW